MVNWFYIGFVTIALLILGGKYPKIALTLSALIFFGAVLFNIETFKKLLNPTTANSSTHNSSSGVSHGGGGGSW